MKELTLKALEEKLIRYDSSDTVEGDEVDGSNDYRVEIIAHKILTAISGGEFPKLPKMDEYGTVYTRDNKGRIWREIFYSPPIIKE